MTPVFANPDGGGMASPALGALLSQDRDGVAVLNDDGIVLFTGTMLDASSYMERHSLAPHCNCELVEDHAYIVGFEAF